MKKVFDEIFQKCVQIILSNFEGNSQEYFMRLDEKLDPNFLIKIFKTKLNGIGIGSKESFDSYIDKITTPKM